METEISQEAEEYVEAIYRLQQQKGVAKTNELAEELHVVPGSITNTIAHLEKHRLVIHELYKGVKLTEKGRKLALNIIRRHRLAERLLTDILHAEWHNVHENACKLEHALTNETTTLLEKRLKNPKICPHGNPIPDAEGEVAEEESFPLTEVKANETCFVAKITDEKQELLLTFTSMGIKLGSPIHVIETTKSKLILRIAGRKHVLSHENASKIWVKCKEEKAHAV